MDPSPGPRRARSDGKGGLRRCSRCAAGQLAPEAPEPVHLDEIALVEALVRGDRPLGRCKLVGALTPVERGEIHHAVVQAAMVYINTLMIQDVLAEPEWARTLHTDRRPRAHPADLGTRRHARRVQAEHEHPPHPRLRVAAALDDLFQGVVCVEMKARVSMIVV